MESISSFYNNKEILITGATGFVGKVLIAKLLHSCPGIKRIYVLIRSKKGIEPKERLKKLLNTKLFDVISDEDKSKVEVLAGDIMVSGIGLNEMDMNKVIENVSVVFHSAATVKFDDALTLSVLMNVHGSLAMMELARKIRNLKAFIHVSTAYCNPHVKELDERVYFKDMPYTPEFILDLVREKGEMLNSPEETAKVLGDWPNTYTFTKALAEKAVVQNKNVLPIAIMRPSIVVASWKDPLPGWIDNFNGPTGIIAGAGTGLLRTMLISRPLVADIIPVDVCANLMIVMAHFISKGNQLTSLNNNLSSDIQEISDVRGTDTVPVFNCVSSNSNPIIWWDIERFSVEYVRKYPFETMFWYPSGSFKSSKLHDRICQLLYHQVPAILYDSLFYVLGKKGVCRTLVGRMTAAFTALEYFGGRTWRFKSDNVSSLYSTLSPSDKNTFFLDVSLIDWKQFMEKYILGVRHYVLKQDPSSIQKHRTTIQYFKLLHYLCKAFFFYVFIKLMENLLQLFFL